MAVNNCRLGNLAAMTMSTHFLYNGNKLRKCVSLQLNMFSIVYVKVTAFTTLTGLGQAIYMFQLYGIYVNI